MSQQRPIVLHGGRLSELPAGRSLAGVAESLAALPLATSALPEAFLVQQGGAWVRATYAQMCIWFPGGAVPAGIVTVADGPITVNGEYVAIT